MINDRQLSDLLARHWDLPGAVIEVHNGGMNSATWWVEHGSIRAVAKHTPGWNRHALGAAMRVATMVEESGIPSGAPIPTIDGDLVVETDGGPLALLRFVPGAEPALDETGLRVIGTTLGRVHLILKDRHLDEARPLYQLDPDAAHLAGAPDWVRPGIMRALAAYQALGPESLTNGLLHTDPAPEAFRTDSDSGTTALIDWAAAVDGPLLYDVASAVMYVGGPNQAGPMLDAYLKTGALLAGELDRGLDVMRGYRWAIQASYFAGRIADGDMTGIEDPAENQAGLEAAREHLAQ
jgi:Ser/Thr protein kinase RdoA (MazF antagonist)